MKFILLPSPLDHRVVAAELVSRSSCLPGSCWHVGPADALCVRWVSADEHVIRRVDAEAGTAPAP